MLSITAVSAGAIDYLLKGSGCIADDGAEEATESGSEVVASGGVEYLLGADREGADVEPVSAGVWFGAGLPMVGIGAGERAGESAVRAVFGQLRHPSSTEEEPVFLGRPPRSFRPITERIEAACAAEPEAGPERLAEITNEVRTDRRKAVAYYDLTFSPVKSVSVLWAALLAAGDEEAAGLVVRAHTEAIAEAMAWAEREVSWTRVGYHGRTAAGRSVGRYEPGTGLVWTRWDHFTNRACEPQLHAHVAVLNRVIARSDGRVRALDGRGFRAVKHGIDAIYTQALEHRLTEWCQVVFAQRPDGKAREILGIDQQLLSEASTRRAVVVERLEEMITEYRARHGHDPGPAARTKLARAAALATRDAKSDRSHEEQVSQWCEPRTARLAQALNRARTAARGVRDQRNHPDPAREDVLVAAVDQVQAQHATWDVGLLMAAIRDQTAAAGGPDIAEVNLPALAAQVLAAPERFGIVQVSAPDPGGIPLPAELRRANGSNVLRPHRDQRYTTVNQLAVEIGIVALARTPGAPAITTATPAQVREQCDSAGLTPDQTAAVVGIAFSGRTGDVLIGPAGTGKSHTLGALTQVWREHTGGRVLGLATSQIATLELIGNGLDALNTTRFLHRAATSQPDDPGFPIQAGDLAVVDEVGMTSTSDLAEITRITAKVGAKLVFTGDPEQLTAIDAGGMLDLLTTDNGCYQLESVHRFTHPWEQAASLRLRDGDEHVLEAYEQHGRIRGGTPDDLTDQAVRGWLADTLTGKTSLLVTASNDHAAELSGRIRAELVRLGRVHPQQLCTTVDRNSIGCGDLIQARRNDHTIQIGPAGRVGSTVTNRATYQVLGPADGGGLRVRDSAGNEGVLPAGYVAEHVTLGYASTVWGAQGRTVDTTHALIEPATTRRGAYVSLTRGRECNTAYVVCERPGDEHDHEPLASTARAQLALVLANTDDEATRSAEQTRRDGITEARSLAWIVGQWDLVATELAQHDTRTVLHALLPAATAGRVEAEPGYKRLCRAVRVAELDGHDTTALLVEAIGQRPLFDANSISDVLRWRIQQTLPTRAPDRDTTAGWTTLTGPRPGPVGEYLTALAAAADTRQNELAAHTVEQAPAWAIEQMGQPPEVPSDRAEWARRAALIAVYRDLAAIPDNATSLGGPPSHEQPLHRALWQHAIAAAGAPADTLDYTTATTGELHRMRAAYRRQLTWAPPYVHDELRDTQIAAAGYRTDAILWAAEAEQLTPGTPERARADSDVRSAEYLAQLYTAHAERLRTTAADRTRWYHDTEPDRTSYGLAGDELTRRGLPRDPNPVDPEQLTLLELDPIAEQLPQEGSANHRAVRLRDVTADQYALLPADTPLAFAIRPVPGAATRGQDHPGRTGVLQASRQLWNETLHRLRHWSATARPAELVEDLDLAHHRRSYIYQHDITRDHDLDHSEALDLGD